MSNENFRLLSEAIDKRASRPAQEQFEEMERRGAIDRDGNVILRRPDDDETGAAEPGVGPPSAQVGALVNVAR